MPQARAPSIIVFDVNETLLDLTTLEPVFERIFGDAAVMRDWFSELILYSEALTLSGLYTPFGELAGGTLRMVGERKDVEISDWDIGDLKDHIGSMPALPDVARALEKLRSAGFRLVTLTNSPPGPSPTTLERAGLSEFFERSFSVDDVSRFKPAPETYRLVAQTLDVDQADLCMVACHLWDTIGAQAAGCSGALVKRPGNAVMHAEGVPLPDIVAENMVHLADQIIALWAIPQTK
jgi:2-haloacid dehalogenase